MSTVSRPIVGDVSDVLLLSEDEELKDELYCLYGQKQSFIIILTNTNLI